jgi:iron complex outermembrane receptor protein
VKIFSSAIAALLCSVPASAWAQDLAEQPQGEAPAAARAEEPPAAAAVGSTDQPAEDDLALDEEEEIVVTAARVRGQVIGDIPPEVTLGARDIRAYGANSVAELLQAIAPQTGSGRGRGGGGGPVILVNGRRISSFSEMRDLPPEAIQRVEIFPEEVALRYGYRADQRVVNLVLRRRFNAVTAEIEGGLATAGGRGVAEIDLNYLTITGPQRTSVGLEYQNQAALLESERDIIQSVGPVGIDQGDFRTLLPETDTLNLSATHNRMLGNVAATVDTRFIASRNRSLLGLPADDPASETALTRQSDSWNGHVGLAFNGDIAPWRWNLTANYDRVETDTVTDRLAGSPPDTAEVVNQSADARLVINGPVADLWAGPLSASLTAAGELRSFDSESTRSGLFRETSLSRQRIEGQASFDLPITSTREGVLDAIGDLSANLNLNAEHLSDFGTLTTIGYGINWRPIEAVSFLASVTHEEGAPGITQLGEPVIATPNVRVFDFVRGETVDITRIDGGNPDLLADSRRVINIGLNVRPLENLSFRANYTDARITNPIASFPAATAEIEAAFPERFTRDASGRLTSIDTRPVNFSSSQRRELRWGFDFSAPWGPQPQRGPFGGFGGGRRGQRGEGQAPPAAGQERPAAGEGQQADRPRRGRGGGGGRGFGRGGGGGAFGGGGGRLQFSLFHTWRLEDRVQIRAGGPELDFLGGSAAGSLGGTPRHQVEARAGVFRDGFGGRVEVDWQSGTRVTGVGGGDLFFSDRTLVNLRLFANLSQQRDLVRAVPFLRGTRVSLNVNNLFDNRVDVRDGFGVTPLSYQPFYLDPLGRSVTISLRKQFF